MSYRFYTNGAKFLRSKSYVLKSVMGVGLTVTTYNHVAFNEEAVLEERKRQMLLQKPRIIATAAMIKQDKRFMDYLSDATSELFDKIFGALGLAGKALKYLQRVFTITLLTSHLLAMGPITYALGSDNIWAKGAQEVTMNYLVWALQQLGPAFIKLAQWASTRPDLYPPTVIEKLQSLQDDVKTHHTIDAVNKTLTKSLGEGWRDKLVLDPKPIGAGCIAQVFKGILQSEGGEKAVAVKVIHPHVQDLLNTDMNILRFFADMMDRVPALEMMSLGDACRNFCVAMNEQLDMTLEAKNLLNFKKHWQAEKWAVFPEPIKDMITKNVLVETLMEGTNISSFMDLKDVVNGTVDDKIRSLKKRLSDMGSRVMIKMIFFDNFIHGDLHPGNILVHMTPEGEPQLVILDCGIVYASKSQEKHDNVIDICIAFMQHDGRKAGRLMLENNPEGLHAQGGEQFIEEIQNIVDMSETQNYFEHIGDYVTRICDLARKHRVKLDPDYFKIAMALKVAEGISLSLDKELDLISKCLPVILKAKAMEKIGVKPLIGEVGRKGEE